MIDCGSAGASCAFTPAPTQRAHSAASQRPSSLFRAARSAAVPSSARSLAAGSGTTSRHVVPPSASRKWANANSDSSAVAMSSALPGLSVAFSTSSTRSVPLFRISFMFAAGRAADGR
jgi:hypothetical protein